MGDKSGIQWTDATWNPVVGCSKVSAGCRSCYAEELHRTRLDGQGVYPSFRPWGALNAEHNVTLVPERLDQPLRWRKPRMVFVNSMSDLFHELVPDDFIAQVFGVMGAASQHTFQVLTKRPERMRDLLSSLRFRARVLTAEVKWSGDRRSFIERAPELPYPNVWLGTSIENQKWVGRADALRATPAAVRWISAEPLLGPLIPGRSGAGLPDYRGALHLDGIDWLVVGGESGPKYRPMNPGWAADLRDHVLRARARSEDDDGAYRTSFFFKQVGGRTPKSGGRLLDGCEWNEYPEVMSAWPHDR